MKIKKILFPVDFSRLSDAGLSLATSLARDAAAELIILHVQEPPTLYGAGEWYYGPLEPDDGALRLMLDKIKPDASDVACRRRLVTGQPATEILRIAEEEQVDMIVMTTHGRTGLARAIMGSVAEAVLRKASCPVVTFKHRPNK